MNATAHRHDLSRNELLVRAGALFGLAVFALGSRLINPETLGWLPFRTSCGAATGLPCLFCGMTRALHHLCKGDFAQALYFNWLAFPIAVVALVFAAKMVVELLLMRKMQMNVPPVGFTPRVAALGGVGLFALWLLQVSLAVSLDKRELLNSKGILYRALQELHFTL